MEATSGMWYRSACADEYHAALRLVLGRWCTQSVSYTNKSQPVGHTKMLPERGYCPHVIHAITEAQEG